MANITPQIRISEYNRRDAERYFLPREEVYYEEDMTGIFREAQMEIQHYEDPATGEIMRRVVERSREAPQTAIQAAMARVREEVTEENPRQLFGYQERMVEAFRPRGETATAVVRERLERETRQFFGPGPAEMLREEIGYLPGQRPEVRPGFVTAPPPTPVPPPVQPPHVPPTATPRPRTTPFSGLSRRMEELRRIVQDPYSRSGPRYNESQLLDEMMQVVAHACAAINTEFNRFEEAKTEMTARIEELEATIDLLNNEP